jgi:HD-GYP domain-containing protein (c-di-GMP phosphodiesterase class II)
MEIDLRVNFLARIGICTILLALFWAGIIYLYQTHEMKKELMAQGKKAAGSLFVGQDELFKKTDHTLFDNLINRSKQQLLHFKIVFLDVYDAGRKNVYRYVSEKDTSVVHNRKELTVKTSLPQHKEKYAFFELQGQGYLQIFGSVNDVHNPLGFFEVLVQVDQGVMDRLKSGRIMAMLMTMGTIFSMALILYPLISRSYLKLQQTGRGLLESNLYTIVALGNAVAKRDSDTDVHNYRVTYYSLCLAEHLELAPDLIRKLAKGAFLHDVGKIGIQDHILLKSGNLTSEEFAVMKTHVELGIQIIKDIPWLADSHEVIRFHHEKYDGNGYPAGLAEKEIPPLARIFAVVDVFDALTSKRPYKAAFSYEDAIEILKKGSQQFDPWVLQGFIEVSKSLYNETGRMSRSQIKERLKAKITHYFGL